MFQLNLITRQNIDKNEVSFYLPGNDRLAHRRVLDEDLTALAQFVRNYFPNGLVSLDLRFNNLINLPQFEDLCIVMSSDHLTLKL